MCGIIGIVGKEEVADRLVDGLRRMEYRGYDSAGVCTVHGGQLIRRRAPGKLNNLVKELAAIPRRALTGIAHTRWATHGAPTRPMPTPTPPGELALVHNGIIENFRQLRDALTARGRCSKARPIPKSSRTWSPNRSRRANRPTEAVKAVLPQLRGAFALAIAFRQIPDMLIGARLGSPLVVGYGDGETYLGSDALALAPLTQKIAYLEEGDWVIITREGAQIFDKDNKPVEREITTSGASAAAIEKGNYRHFMQKEIFEQPTVVAQTLSQLHPPGRTVGGAAADRFRPVGINRITIVACGTSYYAGMVAKYWFEQFARLPVDIDVASEFRYRDPVLEPGGLALFISQSGETADTLAALRHCKEQGPDHRGRRQRADQFDGARGGPAAAHPRRAGNRRRLDQGLHLPAGGAGRARRASGGQAKGKWIRRGRADVVRHLIEAPACLNAALAHDDEIAAMAHLIAPARDVLYLGRGPDYPLALEGALKLKEISYIHAEGYASGEMKHGPIALIDEAVPVIVLARPGRCSKRPSATCRKCARAAARSC
jgi:glucosamine--fructose-6-phosphate aminotransferase (isomerizing)